MKVHQTKRPQATTRAAKSRRPPRGSNPPPAATPQDNQPEPPPPATNPPAIHIPAILLEGDHPALPAEPAPVALPPQPTPPSPAAPTERVAQLEPVLVAAPPATPPAPAAAVPPSPAASVELSAPTPAPAPEPPPIQLRPVHGSVQVWLLARDPHWLYAYWDLSQEQLDLYQSFAANGHLTLNVYRDELVGEPSLRMPLAADALSCFVQTGLADTEFVAELGYFDKTGAWRRLACSTPVRTPPDSVASEVAAQTATLDLDVPFAELLAQRQAAVSDTLPLVDALPAVAAPGHPSAPVPPLTPAQERLLARLVVGQAGAPAGVGSQSLAELVQRGLAPNVSSPAGGPFGPAIAVTSFGEADRFGGQLAPGAVVAPGRRPFWFQLNVELVVYGATEPDAKVAVGERPIQLRPDGTFSLRFSLPDGRFELPVVAVAASDDDGRSAMLHFSRHTDHWGAVGVHPQDPEPSAPGSI